MPLDSEKYSIARANRETLIGSLRDGYHPRWNFGDARHCAVPLARKVDPKFRFGLTACDQLRIFGVLAAYVQYSRFYGASTSSVTPGMVADALSKAKYS